MLSPQTFLVLIYWISQVKGITFSVSNPSQCDPLTVSWVDGSPPFHFLVLSPELNGSVQNITIPSTASQGSYSITLNLQQAQPVIFSMSDSTGVISGGLSSLMTVGASVTGESCDTEPVVPDFFFSLPNSTPVECEPYPFTDYAGASLPISVVVLVPSGQSFVLQAPVGDTFNWPAANLTANTQVSFLVYDALGRNGGISNLLTVGNSDDMSCISSAVKPPITLSPATSSVTTSSALISSVAISPASTPSASIPSTSIPPTSIASLSTTTSSTTLSSTSTPAPGASGASTSKTTSRNSHLAIIAGTAAGGSVILIFLGLLVFYFRRKKSQQSVLIPFRITSPTNEPTTVRDVKGTRHSLPARVGNHT